ncbi:hypothetical protein [Caldimonas tepidiphila]|uniref:hypothetical protein n=1 Tax=Caldimonas tepidiphila TaxID=2315841 RepID=UPI000E5A935B|nr:hypothetical protein [Caldimonas tepidiphila]
MRRAPPLRATGLPAAALAAVLAAGCGTRDGGRELFPLDAGHVWTYAVRTETADGAAERHTLTLRSLPAEPLDGQPAFRRRSDDGVDYWLRSDGEGIRRVASKSDLEAEPKPDAPARTVLRRPYAVGTQWQTPTTAYLLRRTQGFPPELRHSHPSIPMHYAIEAVDEAVEVPAGRWQGCLRVRGQAQLRLYADPVSGWRDLPLVTREWYCPGPGLVKLEREEPANSAFLRGGTLTMELLSWQHD